MQLTAVMASDGYLRCYLGRSSYIYPTQHSFNVSLISGFYDGYALDVQHGRNNECLVANTAEVGQLEDSPSWKGDITIDLGLL